MIIEARDDVVSLEGALNKNLWPTIQAAANLLLRQHVQGIIIDGVGLTGCSPEGAETFRDAMDYIEHYQARIVVCRLPEEVMQVVRTIPGIRSRLPVAASLEEARASLGLARSNASRQTTGGRPLQDILVPILGNETYLAATSLACRLAKADGQKARIHLTYVLEIPRTLPLTAPLPEQENEACGILDAAEKAVRQEGMTPVSHVSRGRDAGEEIVHQAAAIGANIIVLACMPSDDPSDTLMNHVIKTVLDRAPCEVILNKLPSVTVGV